MEQLFHNNARDLATVGGCGNDDPISTPTSTVNPRLYWGYWQQEIGS